MIQSVTLDKYTFLLIPSSKMKVQEVGLTLSHLKTSADLSPLTLTFENNLNFGKQPLPGRTCCRQFIISYSVPGSWCPNYSQTKKRNGCNNICSILSSKVIFCDFAVKDVKIHFVTACRLSHLQNDESIHNVAYIDNHLINFILEPKDLKNCFLRKQSRMAIYDQVLTYRIYC